MGMPKTPAKTIAVAMRYARRRNYASCAEIAQLLRISQQELSSYEQGTKEIPLNILEMIFTLGYTLMRTRHVQYEYWRMRRKMLQENVSFDFE